MYIVCVVNQTRSSNILCACTMTTDLVLSRSNGKSVEGADHQQVVQFIRQSGSQVTLTIIVVSEDEARRLEPDKETGTSNRGVEYYERRSVPVSVPSTEKLNENGKEYVVSVYFLSGK